MSSSSTGQRRSSEGGGGWVGIDLGTSNCSAAVWDLNESRCRVLRLKGLARPPLDGSVAGGKIVPSAVLFERDGSIKVGHEAVSRESAPALTSFKRVVGLTSTQATEIERSDPEFWDSLPFDAVIVDGEGAGTKNDDQNGADHASDTLGDDGGAQSQHEVVEGVAINVSVGTSSTRRVTPLELTTILLRRIREHADGYLLKNKRHKTRAPGFDEAKSLRNCVVGVPANYTHAQRMAVRSAARKAGFDGRVAVMTESTAAAMAYGLFVSSKVSHSSTAKNGKNVLVFDMGGGTTDITIATMTTGDQGGEADKVEFHVVSTAGDRCLGGDNVDEHLARYVHRQTASSSAWKASEHSDLVRQCREAKEALCGRENKDDDSDVDNDTPGLNETTVSNAGVVTSITRQEFDDAIQPLVERAELVVDEALATFKSHDQMAAIHEVVLVGGSTHIPSIRTMLRRKFPPPTPPELCTSLSAETAVSQGLAIQAALLSGEVPLWELRNAMMLDVLPHPIGVWIDANDRYKPGEGAPFQKGEIIDGGGHFVPILAKDATLPALSNAMFTLADIHQPGLTVVAVEEIAPGMYQCMGVFDFLLHRLDPQKFHEGLRQVKIGMSLDESGQFQVSFYDEKDPEHRAKKRRYLEQIENDELPDETVRRELAQLYENEEEYVRSSTEIGLIIFCVVVFALYIGAKIAFHEVDLEQYSNGEL